MYTARLIKINAVPRRGELCYNYASSIVCCQVLDDKNVRRRFRASNYQSTTRVKPFICTMPMRLDDGWNQIQFNLSDFTRRAYGTNYIETLRVQVRREGGRERERERGWERYIQISTQGDSYILLVCMGCREGQAILIAQPYLY